MASVNACTRKPEEQASVNAVALLLQDTILEHYVASYACNPWALAELLARYAAPELFNFEAVVKRSVTSCSTPASDCDEWEDICDEDAIETIDTTQARNLPADTVLGIAMPPGLLTNRPKPTFLGCSLDIRRMVYDFCFSVGHKVYLTYSADATGAAQCAVDRAGRSLMLTCKQINIETSSLVYGENTFFFTPREINGNLARRYHPHTNSKIWLSLMRPDTKRMVKGLRLHLKSPREEDIKSIADGLAGFQKISVEVVRLGTMNVPTRLEKLPLLGRLCKSIAEKRSEGQQTVWHDSGDLENAAMFQLYLPAGYATQGPTQYQMLESPALWL